MTASKPTNVQESGRGGSKETDARGSHRETAAASPESESVVRVHAPASVSSPTNSLGSVYWEDEPERERVVKRLCRSCRWVPLPPLVRLVSPQGIAHEQGTYMREDHTACGKDATGPEWWWRT